MGNPASDKKEQKEERASLKDKDFIIVIGRQFGSGGRTIGKLIAQKLGIDYSHTYSCYCGYEKHCGECGTCRERKQAFEEAGMEDPTEYIQK